MDSALSQNVPNESMMSMTYTPTFGNVSFQIMPSASGKVSNDFGTIPYLSLESVVYLQQMTAQVSPTNIVSGQNSGQQNIQGAVTVQDSLSNTRVSIGFASENTGDY